MSKKNRSPQSANSSQAAAPQTSAGTAEPVEGASFPVFIKALSTVLVVAVIVWSWQTYPMLVKATSPMMALAFAGGGALVMLGGYYGVMIGRTRIDVDTIRQRWLWTRRVDLSEVTHIKLVVIPGFSWLFVPRLIVRTKGWGVTTFQAGNPKLVEAFYRLAREG
jgi:hypothetical protein